MRRRLVPVAAWIAILLACRKPIRVGHRGRPASTAAALDDTQGIKAYTGLYHEPPVGQQIDQDIGNAGLGLQWAAQFGLGWERIHEVNSDLVMVRMPAFGLDGPWRDRTGFAQTMEQISGLAWVTGFRDGPPVIPRGPCDPLAGMHAALALLVALEHRRRTGEGQLVESTMVEAALNATADQVLEWQAYGRLLERDGNHGPVAAPQNLYACRGVEQWIALAVVTDAQWQALVELLGRPAWATDPALAMGAGRRASHERLDGELAPWLAARERDALVAELLARGIPAAPVLHPREAASNPQLRARGFFESHTHPVTGTHELPGLPMRFSGLERWYPRPAPTLGQHTAEILHELLGVGDETIAELEAEGIIGVRPAGLV